MKKISILALGAMIAFISCKKEEGDNQKLDPNNNTTVDFYMSTDVDSWWKYNSTEDGNTTVITRVPTGTTEFMDGFEYDKYIATDSATNYETNEYYAKNEDYYLHLIDLDGSQSNYVRAIVYKENASVGETWTSTHTMSYSGINFDIKIESEITGVDETKSINGKTYDKVFIVKSDLKAKNAILPWTNCGTVEMWFQKGIGLLKTNLDISVLSLFTKKTDIEIIDYYIADE